MFCNKCGAQVPDGTRFCENCGNQLVQDTPSAAVAVDTVKSKKTGYIVMGVAAILVVVLLIFGIRGLIGVFGGNNSPEKPVEYLVDGINKGNVDTVLRAFPKEVSDIVNKNPIVKEALKQGMESAKPADGAKITYKITEKRRMDISELSDFADEINNDMMRGLRMYSGNEAQISVDDAYVLTLEMHMGDNTTTRSIKVFKTKGKWYLVDLF